MDYKSIFDFLKEDKRFIKVYDKCIEVEKSIINKSANTPFIVGRSVSEDLIKIIIKDNPKLSKRFFKKLPDGSDKYFSLDDMIKACKTEKLISNRISDYYFKIKNWGNATVHGNYTDDFINEYRKEHKMLFDISLDCFNKLNIENNVTYKYYLDDYDYRIETNLDEREKQINNIQFNEVNQENLIESFENKTIFIPINFFNGIIKKFENKLINEKQFLKDLKEYSYIDDENVSIIIDYFEESVRDDVKKDIQILHDDLSKDTLKTLNNLDNVELPFKQLNLLIDEADDDNQKLIYLYIKSLAEDLVKSQIEEYKKELETSPITQFAENGRKLLNYKNYKIVEDDFGFSLEEDYENIELDEKQKEAVEYDGEKPLIVDAGPGSGKTRVIIERVVHLVKKLKKPPESILVITFTRKATQELRERLLNETDLDIKDVNHIRISTVHGFARHVISKFNPIPYNYLTRHGERSLFFKKYKIQLGFSGYAFLYNPWITQVLKVYDNYFSFKVNTPKLVQHIEKTMNPYKDTKNKRYRMFIDKFYNENDELECPDYNELIRRDYTGPSYYYRWLNIAKSYPKFLELMDSFSTCDDNTVLVKANSILENEYILNQIPYKNILIDEFQDTDDCQNQIFEKLLKISDTFTIVGDADQSIYGFRGAFPKYFNNFLDKDVKKVTLTTNYRSSRNIVEFNEELIKNKRDDPKNLKSKKKYKAPVYQFVNKSTDDEAINIATLINRLMIDNKIKYYSDIAILFRQNKSIERLIKEFEVNKIPYHLKENKDYLEQSEVKAMLILFWYLMPYDKLKLNHLGDEFLNLSGLASDEFDDIFGLSNKTKTILKNMQKGYELKLTKEARRINNRINKKLINYEYVQVFELRDAIKKEVFDLVNSFDIGLLDKNGLINLGITDEDDLDFFLKLNNLKSRIFGENSSKRLTTSQIFYELLNLTDYFSEISIQNNSDDLKVKDNLALFSHIISDYESIMGNADYNGLFSYLSRVLKNYSSRQNESDEGFNKVHLLSMHSAKGLEYPVVIVGSIKNGICPLNYGSGNDFYKTPNEFLELKEQDPEIAKEKYYDEELRTIYVASTRAKEILILSTIGDNPDDVPGFLYALKHNPKINIKLLENYNLNIIPKIESSKVFKMKNDFPKVKFENIIDDFIYCAYRYDLANNTRFKVKLRNDKYVNMVLLKLLNSIHGNDETTLEDVNEKVNAIINYHNISSSMNAFEIIRNVEDYWKEWGQNYEVIDSNIKILSRLKYCDLESVVDLVIKEGNKFSIIHFIGSDSNIPNIDYYKGFLLFYIHILKEFDEYKNIEFDKVYLHSLENNVRHEIEYNPDYIGYILEYLDEFTESIYNNEFIKVNNCSNCEYYGNVCTGKN